ncbi:MAG: hypothetical protein IPK32_07610 [Verrucomicrobiaceae bacterium]|nr:hypothetical protein [Verrucomicrobiaceae bacterium]
MKFHFSVDVDAKPPAIVEFVVIEAVSTLVADSPSTATISDAEPQSVDQYKHDKDNYDTPKGAGVMPCKPNTPSQTSKHANNRKDEVSEDCAHYFLRRQAECSQTSSNFG